MMGGLSRSPGMPRRAATPLRVMAPLARAALITTLCVGLTGCGFDFPHDAVPRRSSA
jgi:hypothetical protein